MPHEVFLDSRNGPTPRQICSELIKVAINSRQVKGGGSVPIRHGFFYIIFDSFKISRNETSLRFSQRSYLAFSGVFCMISVPRTPPRYTEES